MDIETALTIAGNLHRGQVRKDGTPQVIHSLRVASKFISSSNYQPVKAIVAILHDAIEDSDPKLPVTYLTYHGFNSEIVEAIDAITRRDEETYEKYIERVGNNKIAREVKLADLEDNLQIAKSIDKATSERLTSKYLNAKSYLESLGEN